MAQVVRVPVNPDVLRWARDEAGYDQQGLAKALNTSSERVASWETGSGKPTTGQVRRLARLLRRTPAFFMRPSIPEPDLPSTPDFRRPDIEHAEIVALRRQLQDISSHRRRYLSLAEDVPRFDLRLDVMADPEAAAVEARRRLGFTVTDQLRANGAYLALRGWIAAVESLGILTFQTSDFSLDEARGVSVDFDIVPVVLINAKDPVVARSFTLLHELGHLVMGTGALCNVYESSRAVERACNAFAAAVLMPAADFLGQSQADSDPLGNVVHLAARFKVSEEAAAVRLNHLGVLDDAGLKIIRAQTRARVAQREKEAADNDKPMRIPYATIRLRDLGRTYVGTVLEAYQTERISLTDASQMLDVKVVHIPKMEALLHSSAAAESK